jgi:hypothetical protein
MRLGSETLLDRLRIDAKDDATDGEEEEATENSPGLPLDFTDGLLKFNLSSESSKLKLTWDILNNCPSQYRLECRVK